MKLVKQVNGLKITFKQTGETTSAFCVLSTAMHCFFCLSLLNTKINNHVEAEATRFVSIKILLQYLYVDFIQLLTPLGISLLKKCSLIDLEVELCDNCKRINSLFEETNAKLQANRNNSNSVLAPLLGTMVTCNNKPYIAHMKDFIQKHTCSGKTWQQINVFEIVTEEIIKQCSKIEQLQTKESKITAQQIKPKPEYKFDLLVSRNLAKNVVPSSSKPETAKRPIMWKYAADKKLKTNQTNARTFSKSVKLKNKIIVLPPILLENKKTKKRVPKKCGICNKVLSCVGTLGRHVMSVHYKYRKYECKICLNTYSQWAHLDYHVKTLHLEIREFPCKLCGKVFKAKTTLKTHRSICKLSRLQTLRTRNSKQRVA